MEESAIDSGASWRGRLGMALVPLAGLVTAVAPLGLPPKAHRVAAIFAAVIVAWVTEVVPIAVTSLLIPPALVIAGITTAPEAFAPFGDPLLFLFIGGFFLANAMSRHGLDRRLATGLLTLPFIAGRAPRTRAAFMLAASLVSMWISNSATTAILVPILLGTLAGHESHGPEERARLSGFAESGILAVAYASSLGGLGTLVGTPPNGITMRFLNEAGIRFGFVDWLKIGVPVSLVLSGIALAVVHLRTGGLDRELVLAPARVEASAWNRGERVTLVAFLLAVAGWVLPDLLAAVGSPVGEPLKKALPEGVVAVVASSLVFFLRDERGDRVLPWDEAVKIDWGLLLLFAGGISLGKQIFETGLAAHLGRAFVASAGISTVWELTAIVIVFSLVVTEVASNTACASMVLPLVLAVCGELHVSPIAPALGAGMAATCGFMLPIATGPNAIAYGTGRVKVGTMMRTGIVLDVLCCLALFVLLRLLCPLYGWS
ncbi:MAG: SLC13 family permease [Polyangiales bacterium]